MSTTQNLKFIHLSTGSASAHKADTGAIIFEKATGRIAVATGANTDVEYYGGGRVSDAKFEKSILTLSFNDGSEAITLDFSDVASTSGVNKILGKLRNDVDALKVAVGDDSNGLVKKVNDNASNISANKGEIDANKAAIAAINNVDTGILAESKKYADGLAKNYDAAGAAAQALKDAKDYTDGKVDGKFDTIGSAAQALKDAKSYTDTATNALGGRVTTLEGTVGNASSGLVKDVADLSKLHADKDDKTGKKTVAEEVTAGVNAKVGDIKIDGAAVTVKAYVDAAKEAANKYTDGKVSDINATTAGLRTDVNALKVTVGDASNGLVKDVADNTGKLNTLIGSDAGKSARTIANEELAAQLIPEGAKESLDTLQEIAAWIQAHPDDASAMNGKIAALETTVGDKDSGLVKGVADNKSSINAHDGRITKLEALHASGTHGGYSTVAEEVKAGIAAIPEASDFDGTDVKVTVKTIAGSVSDVIVDASVLKKAVTDETTRATGIEQGLRADLGTKLETEGDAFTRIKALEKNQADGALMWSVWE